ncbi:MAG: hypothetical protein WED82_01380 [Balneolales bacterium]
MPFLMHAQLFFNGMFSHKLPTIYETAKLKIKNVTPIDKSNFSLLDVESSLSNAPSAPRKYIGSIYANRKVAATIKSFSVSFIFMHTPLFSGSRGEAASRLPYGSTVGSGMHCYRLLGVSSLAPVT